MKEREKEEKEKGHVTNAQDRQVCDISHGKPYGALRTLWLRI